MLNLIQMEETIMNITVVNTKGGVGNLPLMFAKRAESGIKIGAFHVVDNVSTIFVTDIIIDFK